MEPGHGDMPGMNSPPPSMANSTQPHHKMMMMMHMTFFWGKNAEILFDGWPGRSSGMYALALVVIFFLAFLVELFSHSQLVKPDSNHVVAGLFQTVMHALRVGLAYLVMLAIMSFNGGVFLVAVAGHSLGFLFFGSRVFRKHLPAGKTSDIPPLSTC